MNARATLIAYMGAMRQWELNYGKRQEAFERGELAFKEMVSINRYQ